MNTLFKWFQLNIIIFLSVEVGDINGKQYIYFVSLFILSTTNSNGVFDFGDVK